MGEEIIFFNKNKSVFSIKIEEGVIDLTSRLYLLGSKHQDGIKINCSLS
jgi:hypothetical protein